MPKEQVMSAKWEKFFTGNLNKAGEPDTPDEPYGSTYPEMYVRWAAGGVGGGNVQVHMVPYPNTTWHDLKVDDEGHPVVWPAPKDEVFSGVLTRQDINNLIRVLRRARDSAYGRDE
jgi:hypothetical protein